MLRYSMEAKWTRVCCGVQYWAPVELLTPPQLLSMLHCIISSWPLAHLIERPRLGHDEEETMTNAICLSELLDVARRCNIDDTRPYVRVCGVTSTGS